MRVFAAVPTARAAAETPSDRDRVVDGARAAALLVVVVGHVLMAVVAWPGGVPVLGNLLASYPVHPGRWRSVKAGFIALLATKSPTG